MLTRFAPSLTGYLHLGHVLHMIYVWGVARSRGAQVLCRMEDHDLGRARPEYESAVLNDMEWLGFQPDIGLTSAAVAGISTFRQSDCSAHYSAVLNRLAACGLVYGCECSRRQIQETQSDGLGELCYSGTCSEKELSLDGHTVRLRIPKEPVEFNDLNLGRCHQVPSGQCGDFSLRDRHGQWTYQFACVCDDIRHGVDLVVRGEDILSSTGRQIQLFDVLESNPPQYFHHALLCDDRGEKLSKRQRSESILRMRESGSSAEEIIGRAAQAGGLVDEFRPLSISHALELVTD